MVLYNQRVDTDRRSIGVEIRYHSPGSRVNEALQYGLALDGNLELPGCSNGSIKVAAQS